MVRYSSDTHVVVHPLSRQSDAGGILVGRKDLGVFLLLPEDAVEVLDDLAQGKSVGEAATIYRQRHGVTPDLDDLLTSLEQRDFVRPLLADGSPTETEASDLPRPPATLKSFHFEWISPRWAARLCGWPTLAAGGLIVLLAAAAVLLKPSLAPGWRAAYFPNKTAAGLLLLMVLGLFTTFLHEMAHLVAARSRGISCRFGIGTQLWFLVWETDMTGIWSLPRRQRYLPILAGPLFDLVTASALVLAGYAQDSGWIVLQPRVLQLGRALLFIYLLRIAWQCYFFLRTDFYYALSNLLGCKSLMKDTKVFLRNTLARLLRIGKVTDQSHIPAVERRMIPVYSVIWIVGRGLAFSMLLFVQIPLFFHYATLAIDKFRHGTPSVGGGDATVPILTAIFFSIFFLSGFGLWIKQLWPKKGTSA
jgi:hypothetical protein